MGRLVRLLACCFVFLLLSSGVDSIDYFSDDLSAFCFVDQMRGNDTDSNCGALLSPCMTIQTCMNQMILCCETYDIFIVIQSNLTAIEGNYNITIDESVHFPSLSISGKPSMQWDLEHQGFAIASSINRNFTLTLDLLNIYRSSSSAVQINADSISVGVSLKRISFYECHAQEGAALYANFSGTMILNELSVYNSQASQCGGISIHGNNLALITVGIGSALSFVNTEATTFGGCMCLFLDPAATFWAVYTPSNFGMISAVGCRAGSEGLLYIDGGIAKISSSYCSSSRSGSGGFLTAKNMKKLQINAGVIQNQDTKGSGAAMAISNSDNVNITAINIQSCVSSATEASGTIYLDSVTNTYLNDVTIGSNTVTGYGGGLYLNNTSNVTVMNSAFLSNQAKSGASFACTGYSSNTRVVDVTMSLGRVTSPSMSVDVWSDGTCDSPFWYPPTRCQNNTCSSCPGDVCSDNLVTCQCYCTGDPNYTCPSASPTQTPSPTQTGTPTGSLSITPSRTPSATPTHSVSSSATHTEDHHYGVWVLLVSLLIVVIVFLGLGYGIYYWMKHRNTRHQYHNIN